MFVIRGYGTVFLALRKGITYTRVRDFDEKIVLRRIWAQEHTETQGCIKVTEWGILQTEFTGVTSWRRFGQPRLVRNLWKNRENAIL
jgi:hypothetical protein